MENLWHEFKYYVKNVVRDKSLLFYLLAFPLILGTLYYFASSSLIQPEIEVEQVAVVTENESLDYESIFEDIEPFDLLKMSEEEAQTALEDGEIIGYIDADDQITIAENSTSASILKGIMDQVNQTIALGADAQYVDFEREYLVQTEIPASYITIMFYGLIGMISLYGAFRGVDLSNEIYAPMSPFAARLNITPLKKYSYILLNFVIAVAISFFSTTLLIVFLEYLVDFQVITDYGVSLLLVLCMNVLGVSIGMICGILPNLSEQAKSNVALTLVLGLSMLSGGMTPQIPALIYRTAPWLMKINPVNVFTENFYKVNLLNDYSTLQSGTLYIILFTAALTAFVIIYLRGKRYDHV